MSLLAPAGLLALGSLPIVLLFYLLRVRLRGAEVSSTYLWERLLQDLSAQDPWQRPRFTALMLIQMLLLAVLALALARPAIRAFAPAPRFEVLVLQTSASMQSTDVAPNRFAEARRLAMEAVRALSDGSTVAVVAAGSRPVVLVAATKDREAALAAIERAEAEATAVDLAAALRLADAVAAGQSNAEVRVFSDAAFDQTVLGDASTARLQLVTGGDDNRAIVELAARADPRNNRHYQLFVRLANFADQPKDATLGLYGDGNLFDSRQVRLAAGSRQDLIVDGLPNGATAITARLLDDDDLAVDNSASVVLQRRHPTRVLMVSAGNLFLQRALGLLPNVELSGATPTQFPGIATEYYDLLVFDSYLPENLPPQNFFVINPPNSALLSVGRSFAPVNVTSWQGENPLLQYVSLHDLRIQRAEEIKAPDWAKTLIEAGGQPLLMAGEIEGHRVTVAAFDLRESNLPLLAAFPILVANVVGYLEPPEVIAQRTFRTGSAIEIHPLPQADRIVVGRPDGSADYLPTGKTLVYAKADQAGIYAIRQFSQGRAISTEQFAANLLDDGESDIAPSAAAEVEGRATDSPEEGQQPVEREIWQWIAVGGIAVLGFEWWWYHRRA